MRKLIELIEIESQKQGKSKRDMAKCIGVSESTYYRLVKTGEFTVDQVDLMVKMLNISLYAFSSDPVKLV